MFLVTGFARHSFSGGGLLVTGFNHGVTRSLSFIVYRSLAVSLWKLSASMVIASSAFAGRSNLSPSRLTA